MAARLMWGTPNTAAEAISEAALERAEQNDYAILEAGDRGGPPTYPGGSGAANADMPAVPATRLIYVVEDDDSTRLLAVADESVAGNSDVLAAVEEEWKARTGRDDVRPDTRAEPPADQPAVDESA